jgi:tRNA(Ile)-lysidine synthase
LPFNLWPQLPLSDPVKVVLPGQINLAGGWKFTSERWRIPALAQEQAARNEDQFQVWLDADTMPESLELRTRVPGDQFEPLGLGNHSQKLSDFMVNVKMPQRARDHWPLLCSGEQIIWVPGYRPAHPFRLTGSTNNILYFSVSRPPDKIME